MSGLPKGWVMGSVGQIVADMQYGSSAKTNDDALGVPVLRMGNIQDGKLNLDALKYLPQDHSEFPDLLLKKGDLLFNRTNSPELVGKSAVYAGTPARCSCASYLIRVRLHQDCSPDYLAFYLNSMHGRSWVASVVTQQVGQANVNGAKLKALELPIPPANEQRRIVAKVEALFSELEAGVAALKQARAQLAVYRQALLRDAFEGRLTAHWRSKHAPSLETGEQLLERIRERQPESAEQISAAEAESLPQLPEGWCHARFGEFIQAMSAGKSFSCEERPPRSDEIGVAKVSAVTWGEYLEEESKTCRDASKINPSYFIQAGDFLLSRANTIDLVGASVIVKHVTKRIMLSDKTLRLTIEGIPPYFLLYYLRSRQGRREIMSRSTGNQESMRNIGQDRIRSIIVPVCSGTEALKIVEMLEAQLSELDALETDIDVNLGKAEALRQAILKKAFAGELVPQDPADETAAALLARIQAEREAKTIAPAKRTARRGA